MMAGFNELDQEVMELLYSSSLDKLKEAAIVLAVPEAEIAKAAAKGEQRMRSLIIRILCSTELEDAEDGGEGMWRQVAHALRVREVDGGLAADDPKDEKIVGPTNSAPSPLMTTEATGRHKVPESPVWRKDGGLAGENLQCKETEGSTKSAPLPPTTTKVLGCPRVPEWPRKLKQFKILGQGGEPGQKKKFSFSIPAWQRDAGRQKGFSGGETDPRGVPLRQPPDQLETVGDDPWEAPATPRGDDDLTEESTRSHRKRRPPNVFTYSNLGGPDPHYMPPFESGMSPFPTIIRSGHPYG